jgi:hypothetical protein
MCTYLIHAANGDIYQRNDSNILDDLADHLDHAMDLGRPIRVERWVRESDLERHRRPNQTIHGFDAVLDWALERTDGEDDRFNDLLTRSKEC